jgi:hypothetical protein
LLRPLRLLRDAIQRAVGSKNHIPGPPA